MYWSHRAGLKPMYALGTGQPYCPAPSTCIMQKLTRPLDAKCLTLNSDIDKAYNI
jgi:hypothetical protein